MGNKTAIQWCDATWNIARGCTKKNEDCLNCYMMRDGDKFGYKGNEVIRTKTVFNLPLMYPKTKSDCWYGNPLIFTSSLTDIFHKQIDSYRNEMWAIIKQCPHLIFLLLTKRWERVADNLPEDWGEGYKNVWLGFSAGSQKRIDESYPYFENISAKIKWYSIEPLIKPITKIPDVDWIVVGGESGNDSGKWKYRKSELKWYFYILHLCTLKSIPLFVKQLGTYLSKDLKLSNRHGSDINEFPTKLRIRMYPI